MMSSPTITADEQVARIFEWRRGFNTIWLLDLGVRLGLFTALAAQPGASAGELATKLSLDPRCVDTLLFTCAGMAIVTSTDDQRYTLAPHMDVILARPGHPRYLGGFVGLATDVAAEDFRALRDAARTGAVKPFQKRGEDFARLVGESTWGLQVLTARKLLPELGGLPARLAAGGTVLEVGCGTGNLLMQLAKAFPEARCVGVDIDPDGLAVAGRRIAEAGLGERVQVRHGAIGEVMSPGSADAIVMVEVLHEIGQAIRPQVIRECAAALAPGGWLVIVDETYPANAEEAASRDFLFPLHTGFEEMYWGNVIPTREEQERLIRDAGLDGPINRSIVGEGFTVLSVQRATAPGTAGT